MRGKHAGCVVLGGEEWVRSRLHNVMAHMLAWLSVDVITSRYGHGLMPHATAMA